MYYSKFIKRSYGKVISLALIMGLLCPQTTLLASEMDTLKPDVLNENQPSSRSFTQVLDMYKRALDIMLQNEEIVVEKEPVEPPKESEVVVHYEYQRYVADKDKTTHERYNITTPDKVMGLKVDAVTDTGANLVKTDTVVTFRNNSVISILASKEGIGHVSVDTGITASPDRKEFMDRFKSFITDLSYVAASQSSSTEDEPLFMMLSSVPGEGGEGAPVMMASLAGLPGGDTLSSILNNMLLPFFASIFTALSEQTGEPDHDLLNNTGMFRVTDREAFILVKHTLQVYIEACELARDGFLKDLRKYFVDIGLEIAKSRAIKGAQYSMAVRRYYTGGELNPGVYNENFVKLIDGMMDELREYVPASAEEQEEQTAILTIDALYKDMVDEAIEKYKERLERAAGRIVDDTADLTPVAAFSSTEKGFSSYIKLR